MHQDRRIVGRPYRVIVEPVGAASPMGMTLAVYVDDNPVPIYKKLALPSDTEETLITEGWSFAEHHASNS